MLLRAIVTQDGQSVTADAEFTLTGGWDNVLQGTFEGDVVVPAGERWLIGDATINRGSLRCINGVIAMRPGSHLRFTGGIAAEYVGGGMTWGPLFANDFGLWIGSEGALDIQGTPKAGWNRTGTDPSWLPTDELWIAPTAAGDFSPRRWFPGQEIPRVDARVPAAEIVNVTRDCIIEGVGHIHINSTLPQRIEYVRLEGLGISHAKFFTSPHDDPSLNGRYALHLHMGGNGSVVRGVAAVGCRGKVFVPHGAHGVTMVDNVSVNSWSSAFWWDEGAATNDILVDRLAVLGVELPWEVLDRDWSNKAGIVLGEGERMEIKNSVVAGVRGWDSYAGGFDWINPVSETPRAWVFQEGNVSHNNAGSGLRFWTNLTDAHYTANFVTYRNRTNGIEAGAYQNGIQWENGLLLDDHIMQAASSKANELGQRPFYRNVHVEASNTPAVVVGHRVAETHPGMGVQFIDCTLIAGAGHPKVLVADGANPWFGEFIRSGVLPEDVEFLAVTGNEGSQLVIDPLGDGGGWIVAFVGGQKVVTER